MGQLTAKHKDEIVYKFYDHFRKIPFLNRGGCGVFAKFLFDRLVELGYKPQLILHLKNNTAKSSQKLVKQLETSNMANCLNLERCGIIWYHTTVRIGDIYIDANGSYITKEHKTFALISKETLEAMIADEDYWYHAFDFRRSPEKIRKALQGVFA